MKKRVHELAKELNIESKKIIQTLSSLGISVKFHMNVLDTEDVERLMLELEKEEKSGDKDTVRDLKKRKEATTGQTKESGAVQAPKELNFSESGLEHSDKGLESARINTKALNSMNVQEDNVTRAFHYKSGLVDRVPSRPPDKRFHEPIKSTSRTAFAGKTFGKQQPAKEDKTRSREQHSFPARLSGQDKPVQEVQDNQKAFDSKSKTKEQKKKFGKEGPPVGSTTSKFPWKTLPGRHVLNEKSRPSSHVLVDKLKSSKWSKVPQQDGRHLEAKNYLEKPGSAPKPEENLLKLESKVKKTIVIEQTVTVQELALKIQKRPVELIKKLMDLGIMATINQEIDADTAIILASEFGYELEVKEAIDEEAFLLQEPVDVPELMEPRAPVVTIMGHVDHGKTSLLDVIRETNVTASEFGGITQHIGAYQVEHGDKKITFVDTPGHEAFTAMRARGAQVTDIVIVVVAAEDGIMPQTVEAINHAKDASVPIIIAINKIDKPDANPERVRQQLTEYGLVSEEWGGDTVCVEISAKEKQGLNELLEMILLVAEMIELKANPQRPAQGTVIESELDKGRGPVAAVLVQNGVLKVGDVVVADTTFGRVRAMVDDKGQRVKKAGPSVPVEVLGFSHVPQAGSIFNVVTDEKVARLVAEKRQLKKREEELKTTVKASLDDLFKEVKEHQVKELRLIIKADAHGSVEALKQALEYVSTEEVKVNIIHTGVGAISETDIMLASASNATVIGFNVRPNANARKASETEKIDVRLYRLIYDVIENVKTAMNGLLEPEYKEVVLGRVEVRKIFKVSKIGTIAGCYVSEGKISRDANVRLIHDGIVIYEGKLDSLKRFKDDVREVAEGHECGLTLEKYNEIKEKDIIEVFVTEAIKKELVSSQ